MNRSGHTIFLANRATTGFRQRPREAIRDRGNARTLMAQVAATLGDAAGRTRVRVTIAG